MKLRIGRRGWLLCLPLLFIGVGVVTAQPQDVIGLYFDEDGIDNEAVVPVGMPVTAYLCILDASQVSGVSGWECQVSWNEDYTILAWNLRGGALNIGTPPEFIVGLAQALPWAPSIVLMDILVEVLHEGTCAFYLHPTSIPTIPDFMAYAAGNNPGLIVPLNWPTGGEEYPVATFESLSWPAECTIEPPTLDFGEVPVGGEQYRSFTITNSGGEPLVGHVPDACDVFEVVSGAGDFNLLPSHSLTVTVRFAPAEFGDFSCDLDLGSDICDVVPCSGTGILLPPMCMLDPPFLEFGEVVVGYTVERVLTISNAGGDTLSGVVPDSCGVFQVIEGVGPFSLLGGESHPVHLRFGPESVGEYNCSLVIGGTCAPVPCHGMGIAAFPQCELSTDFLGFGSTNVGDTSYRSFTIGNTGNAPLTGNVAEDCVAFEITSGGGPFSLDAGQDLGVTVAFSPLAEGVYSCTVTTGTPLCGDVHCIGLGVVPPPDEDFLGLYFDQEATINEVEVTSPGPVSAYLCITEASEPSGVSGWECLVSWTGDFPILAWNIYGQAINIGGPPEFVVGLATPLPWAEAIVLMEAVVGVYDEGVCAFYLHPTSSPSIPGHMAYAARDDPSLLIPLNWSTGGEQYPVATINSLVEPFDCNLDPAALAFSEIEVGEEDFRTFTISNDGGQPLSGQVPQSCDVFAVVTGAGEFILLPGESHDATVQFAPPDSGLFTCNLNFGNEFCDELPLTGTGVPNYPICAICPANLEFDQVLVGDYIDRIFNITNAGGDTLTGVVPAACGVFEVIEGAGSFSLPRNQPYQVRVRFAPPDLGVYTCNLVIEGICDDVPLQGEGVDELAQCTVSPDHLNYCPTLPGQTAWQSFTVSNGGTLEFSGEVAADCSAFQITEGGGPYSLEPGEQHEVVVTFTPPGSGDYTCTVSLGSPYCDDVFCQGSGSPLFSPPDIIGIYFDASGLTDSHQVPAGETVSAYLCLRYGAERAGVAGWQCRVNWNHLFPVLAWNLSGNGVNVAAPPEFVVSLAQPLPWQETVVLLEMSVFIADGGPCEFYIHPVDRPTIPSRVSYQPGNDLRHIIPMNWSHGSEDHPVAIINPHEESVGIVAELPHVSNVTGGVLLSWSYDETAVDGFHIYRRTEQQTSVRLTEVPVNGWSGRVEYSDPAAGIVPGTVLYYSYAMMRDGVEIDRSDEVSITLSGSTPTVTVLHANYPNPFNPITHLVFELARAGHVRLEVFDLAGRKIRTLADEPLPAAVHERQWDGRDDRGRIVPSGTYYCRMEAGGLTAMCKMLLLK